MSAWGIGSVAAARVETRARVAAEGDQAPAAPTIPPVASVDTLISWIPGEVIAAYAAIVLALQPDPGASANAPLIQVTSVGWVIAGVIFAGLLTWLGGWSKTDRLSGPARTELLVRVPLAAAAFAIWSFVIPGSWWYSIDPIADHQTLMPILAGIVGATFGMLAEGLVRRLGGTVTQ
jgi:hypothetical protein